MIFTKWWYNNWSLSEIILIKNLEDKSQKVLDGIYILSLCMWKVFLFINLAQFFYDKTRSVNTSTINSLTIFFFYLSYIFCCNLICLYPSCWIFFVVKQEPRLFILDSHNAIKFVFLFPCLIVWRPILIYIHNTSMADFKFNSLWCLVVSRCYLCLFLVQSCQRGN